MKFEKPQPGNPHRLTVGQHVIAVRSLARFAGDDGLVQVMTVKAPKILSLTPENAFFTVRRVWDQRTEAGWMKQIEDRFQALADDVLAGRIEHITGDDGWTITHYFSLWYFRSRQEPPREPDVQFAGITGEQLSQDQEERFEKMHVMFAREGGRMPTRFLNGIQLQTRVDQYAHQVLKSWTWGVIQAKSGEFVLPDVPHHGFIPLTPKVLLAANHPNGTILKSNLIEINVSSLAYTWAYFVARNVQTALAGVTNSAIAKAVKLRDAKLASGELVDGPIPSAG